MICLAAAIAIGFRWPQAVPHKPQKPAVNSLLVQLESKVYPLSKPMEISASGVTLDGHGATLQGKGAGVGLHIGPLKNVTIKNLKITGFAMGLLAEKSASLTLVNVTVMSSKEGIGIRLDQIAESFIQGVQVHGCATGVSIVSGAKVTLEKSDLSQNDKSGLVLFGCSTCLIRDNRISFIGSTGGGSGISIDAGSNHNQILRNTVVHCKSQGISLGLNGGLASTDNTLQSNDVSWTEGGIGLAIQGQTANMVFENAAAHCETGMRLVGAVNTHVRGNLLVGNAKAGIEDESGSKNSYESNAFALDTGGPIAMKFKGKAGTSSEIRVFQNTFMGYARPIHIENASPITFQSNTFVGTPTASTSDLIEVVGPQPLVLGSQTDDPKSDPFAVSAGPIAAVSNLTDRVSGVRVSSLVKPDSEVVVEGSLTGAFQGEEEVLARYKGELPVEITFPPRAVAQVRIKGVPNVPAAFLILMGDHSLAKGREAEDSGDTLIIPDEATDGDITTVDHGWHPPHGKAGEWWQVDLKEEQSLTAVSILANVGNPNAFWGKFRIQVSSTGLFKGEETTVVTETNWNERPGPLRTYRFAPTSGRYIRIIGDQDQAGVLLAQFSAYGISK